MLDFVPSDSNEWPEKLDMLIETLSESNIQLLNSRVKDDKYQQNDNITNNCVANASTEDFQHVRKGLSDKRDPLHHFPLFSTCIHSSCEFKCTL